MKMVKNLALSVILSGGLILGGCTGNPHTDQTIAASVAAGVAGLAIGSLVTRNQYKHHYHKHRYHYYGRPKSYYVIH